MVYYGNQRRRMKIIWKRDAGDLVYQGIHFNVWCKVRNEIDLMYVRRLHDPKEVIYAIVNGQKTTYPYMPRKFPIGTWEIIGIEASTDPIFAPFKIRTNADQLVETWTLDEKGGYDKPTGKKVLDGGYLLHCSNSMTTHGCGRVETEKQVKKLAGLIASELARGKVYMEVV